MGNWHWQNIHVLQDGPGKHGDLPLNQVLLCSLLETISWGDGNHKEEGNQAGLTQIADWQIYIDLDQRRSRSIDIPNKQDLWCLNPHHTDPLRTSRPNHHHLTTSLRTTTVCRYGDESPWQGPAWSVNHLVRACEPEARKILVGLVIFSLTFSPENTPLKLSLRDIFCGPWWQQKVTAKGGWGLRTFAANGFRKSEIFRNAKIRNFQERPVINLCSHDLVQLCSSPSPFLFQQQELRGQELTKRGGEDVPDMLPKKKRAVFGDITNVIRSYYLLGPLTFWTCTRILWFYNRRANRQFLQRLRNVTTQGQIRMTKHKGTGI